MIDESPIPVVLCCAREIEPVLGSVVDALLQAGHAPEVLAGVESDSAKLTRVPDRIEGPGVFVLCQSASLGRSQVLRLEGLFSARKGPEHRMITIDVTGGGFTRIVSEVERTIDEIIAGPERGADPAHLLRDVVMPAGVAAAPGARRRAVERSQPPPSFPEIPADLQGISDEALGMARDAEVHDPDDPRRMPGAGVPEPDVLISTDPSESYAGHAAYLHDERPSDGIPTAIAEDFPVVGGSSDEVATRGRRRRPGVPEVQRWDRSGPVEVERVARGQRPDPRAEADDTPLPSSSAPIEVGRPAPEPAVPSGKQGRVALLLIAAAGMGAIVAMAVMHATASFGTPPTGPGAPEVGHADGDAPAPGGSGADRARATSGEVASAASAAAHGGTEAAATEGHRDAALGDTGTASTTGAEAAGATTGTAQDVASEGDTEAVPPESATTGAAAEPAGDGGGSKLVPPPPTALPSDASLAAAIELAVAEGTIQAAGELLASSGGGGTMEWEAAAGRCRRKKVDRIRGWKLPSKGQLVELRKAGILTSGSYWSRSMVGGDEVYAFDASTGRMNVWLKIEPNARAMCVRTRP